MKKQSSLFIFILSLFLFSCANQITPIKEEKGCISIALPGNSVGRAVSMTDITVEAPETYYISVHRGENTEGSLVSLQSDLRPGAVFELTDLEPGTYTIYIKAMSKKNIFEQTKTVDIKAGNNKVVINLEHITGAVGFKLTGTKVSKEYPLIINFTNPSTGFDRQIKIPETDPDGTFNIYHMPEGTYKMTIAPRKYFKYKYSETVEVKNGKITSAYSIEAIPDAVLYVDSSATSSSELGTAASPFKTIDKAIEKMNSLDLSGGTIYIKGSVPTSLVFEPSSTITNLVIERAPGATTAELIAKEEAPDCKVPIKPIITSNNNNLNITLKDLTLTTKETTNNIGQFLVLNNGTCSLNNINIPEPTTGVTKFSAISITKGNLRIGGTIAIPDKAEIRMNISENGEYPTIIISSPLTVSNSIIIPLNIMDSSITTGMQLLKGENNVNMSEEISKFYLVQNDQNAKYGFDETGCLKKTHVPIYIETDVPGNASCTDINDGNCEYYLKQPPMDNNHPHPITRPEGEIYLFPIGKELQIRINFIPHGNASGYEQVHKITPIGTKDNIIKFYTNNNVYVSTTGNDTNSGLNDKPVKTVSKAVELIESKILNPTLVPSTSPYLSTPSIVLTQNQTFTETAPITIDKAIKFRMENHIPDQAATISNGTTDNEIFIINNPNADITLGKGITIDSGFTTNSTKGLIKVVQGNLSLEENCTIGSDSTNMNGIYVSKNASVTIRGYSQSGIPINKPIYLENGASITAEFTTLQNKPIKVILADDFDLKKQAIKPASGTELTPEQIKSFKFVTNADKTTPLKYDLDKNGIITPYMSMAEATHYMDGHKDNVNLTVKITKAEDFITLGMAIEKRTASDGTVSLIIKAEPAVTEIPDSSFKNCTKLISVTLPSTIKTIGAGVFTNAGITELIIPPSVETVGDLADSNITKLTTPCGPGPTGGISYTDNTKLEEITLTKGSKNNSTTAGMFTNCSKLHTVNFAPDSTIEILDQGTFEGCTNLTTITIPDKIHTISYYTFQGCTNLTSVIFENTSKKWRASDSTTSQENIDVSKPDINATNLKKDLVNYLWMNK